MVCNKACSIADDSKRVVTASMSMAEEGDSRRGNLDSGNTAGHDGFGGLFEFSSMPMAVYYEDYRPVALNNAFSELLGVPRETLLSGPTLGYVHPDDRDAARHGMDMMFARADVPPTGVVRMFCAEGVVRSIEASTSVTYGTDGTKYLLMIFRDISEERWNRGQ